MPANWRIASFLGHRIIRRTPTPHLSNSIGGLVSFGPTFG